MITMTLEITPVAKGRARHGRGFTYTPQKTRAFENSIRVLGVSGMQGRKPLHGPLKLAVRFVMKSPKRTKNAHPCVKPDVDNLIKSLTDSLNNILWIDDSQIVEVSAVKVYDLTGGLPRIELTVEEIT